eukprot:2460199-Prymnesium_polylepis.1
MRTAEQPLQPCRGRRAVEAEEVRFRPAALQPSLQQRLVERVRTGTEADGSARRRGARRSDARCHIGDRTKDSAGRTQRQVLL